MKIYFTDCMLQRKYSTLNTSFVFACCTVSSAFLQVPVLRKRIKIRGVHVTIISKISRGPVASVRMRGQLIKTHVNRVTAPRQLTLHRVGEARGSERTKRPSAANRCFAKEQQT